MTPQQNGVVERKNRTLVEAARTMLAYSDLPLCYVLNDRENLSKFQAKADEGIFIGYSLQSKAYRIYNTRTKTVLESINVTFDESKTRTSEHNSSELVPKDKASTSCSVEPDLQKNKHSQTLTESDLDLLFLDAFNDITIEDNNQTQVVSEHTTPDNTSEMVSPLVEPASTSAVSGEIQPETTTKEATTSAQCPTATEPDLPAIQDEFDNTNDQTYIDVLPSTHK
ncbi:hypothetical protein L6452_26301 [Arctium lappa]|uniref:Uncharacterized protein n=1 Tax=Arctium lappa TaxID=4217 RepID=A0ACB9AC06_ARCLA|nr:hypothetical protein L6452_26301 [Arctium lappa]